MSDRQALIDRYHHVVCDIDGVLIRGKEAVPGAAATLAALRQRGISVALATNNASRTPEEVAAWLQAAGLQADPAMVVTSAQAAALLLSPGERALVVGTEALLREVDAAGAVRVSDPRQADVVVVGFNPDLRYVHLRDAALALHHGARFLATNLDANLPTGDAPLPGNGAICAALTVATGREPEVAGKPGAALIERALAAGAERPDGPVLVVGDRLETDIVAGAAAGCDTALVLTGASAIEQVADADPAPTWVLPDVTCLLRPPPDQQ